jgi:hypothetical protein
MLLVFVESLYLRSFKNFAKRWLRLTFWAGTHADFFPAVKISFFFLIETCFAK